MSHTRTVNVQAFLNENRFSPYQWMIFIICLLIAFFDGMDTAAIGYVAPSLLEEWGMEKKELAPVLSAALFGLAIGAMTSGPLADKFGRKIVLTASVLLFSGFCVASAYAADLTQMTVLRFITGLGLGAAMPNAVAMLSEYCPERNRALILNTMYCGFPVGAAAGVMGSHFRAGSILLWIAYFMGLIIFYAMINWMPVLFKEVNMPPELGPRISGLFALGGLGAIASGWLMDKFNGNRLIAFLSFLTALSVASIGWALGQGVGALVAVVLFAGVMHNTAQSSLPALAAKFYPTECRATGVSWMLGIGRFGAIAGTFLTGQLIAWKLDFVSIFIILAIPSLILSVCLLLKQKIYGDS